MTAGTVILLSDVLRANMRVLDSIMLYLNIACRNSDENTSSTLSSAIRINRLNNISKRFAQLIIQDNVQSILKSPSMWNNSKIMSECVKKDANLFRLAPYLNDNDDLAFSSSYRRLGLEYLSDRLRSNKELLLLAISHNCRNVYTAPKVLKKDHDVIVEAYKYGIDYIKYPPDRALLIRLSKYKNVLGDIINTELIYDGAFLRTVFGNKNFIDNNGEFGDRVDKIKIMEYIPVHNPILNDLVGLVFSHKFREEYSNILYLKLMKLDNVTKILSGSCMVQYAN